jgi:hypothetical protein
MGFFTRTHDVSPLRVSRFTFEAVVAVGICEGFIVRQNFGMLHGYDASLFGATITLSSSCRLFHVASCSD